VTLVGIALFAWLIVYSGRRLGFSRSDRNLRLRGRLALDGRRAVYLVEVAGKVLVLGAGEGGIQKLAELPEGSLLDQPRVARASSFSELLSRLGTSTSADPPLVAEKRGEVEARQPE
jgi:flagellar biogenesis protein FliO